MDEEQEPVFNGGAVALVGVCFPPLLCQCVVPAALLLRLCL